jgi:hypothetical protein
MRDIKTPKVISAPILIPSLRGGAVANTAAAASSGGGGGGGGPSGVRIQHRIGVKAPAEVIWEIIYDLAKWPEWNPIYPKVEGEIRIGSTLTLTLALPGEAHETLHAKILDWVPNEQLHWQVSLMGGLARMTRFIEIDALSETGSMLSNGEIYGGWFGPTVARSKRVAIRKGFTQMGEALAERAEALWRERESAPTSKP